MFRPVWCGVKEEHGEGKPRDGRTCAIRNVLTTVAWLPNLSLSWKCWRVTKVWSFTWKSDFGRFVGQTFLHDPVANWTTTSPTHSRICHHLQLFKYNETNRLWTKVRLKFPLTCFRHTDTLLIPVLVLLSTSSVTCIFSPGADAPSQRPIRATGFGWKNPMLRSDVPVDGFWFENRKL